MSKTKTKTKGKCALILRKEKRKKKKGSAAFGHSKYTLKKISINHGLNLYGAIGLLIAFSKNKK